MKLNRKAFDAYRASCALAGSRGGAGGKGHDISGYRCGLHRSGPVLPRSLVVSSAYEDCTIATFLQGRCKFENATGNFPVVYCIRSYDRMHQTAIDQTFHLTNCQCWAAAGRKPLMPPLPPHHCLTASPRGFCPSPTLRRSLSSNRGYNCLSLSRHSKRDYCARS